MKKFVPVLGLLLTASVFAHAAEDSNGVEVYTNIKKFAYAKSVEKGNVTPGEEWGGTRIFRLQDGSCVQIVRSNFKIVKVGDLEVPEFKQTKATVTCPKEVSSK